MLEAVVLSLLVAGPGGDLRLESPVYCGSGDSQLYLYDDGTAYWLTWSGLWRGVWFTMDDFGASGNSLVCDYAQFWFYHHSYSWDTCAFYAELWTNGSGMPETLLAYETVIATHYSADYSTFDPPIDAGNSFWVLVNSSPSSGGWPSSLGDGTPQPSTSHSFHSDDFEKWVPWVITGTYANDFLIRAHGSFLSIEESTWAGIKGLFR
jgi:hypothetical protein